MSTSPSRASPSLGSTTKKFRTPSMSRSDAGKDPAIRAKVLAVGGVAGTMEELTGHKQELRVSMGLGSLLALTLANVAPSTAINGSLGTSLISGGTVAILWGWVIVALLILVVAASLAEMCSAWPHAAGQALWSFQLAPPRWAPFLSFWTGWMNIAGGWALIAAGAYILADGILALAMAYHPTYAVQSWHLVLVYILALVVFFVVNLFIVRVLDSMTKGFAVVNLSSVAATIIALAACAPVKQSPSFVFTSAGWLNETGWSSRGFVFLLGLLQSGFVFVGIEASAHLCEEAHDAGRLAPIAVLGGTALVGLTGFCWIIALLFSIQSLDDILGAAVPVLQIFQDSFGLRGATAAFAINLVVLSFATIGILMASSRAVWSMARDGGFPLSRAFKKVDKRFDVPVNALLVQIFVPTILGLIYLGSTVIFYAFFQVAVVGYLSSYFIPIALLLFRGRDLLPPAYWRLPSTLAKACNLISLLYITFISVLFCLPNFYPVTGSNMNYTSAIVAVVVLIGTVAWYVEVRHKYRGPASAVHVEEDSAKTAEV
ncbi:amino acid/polyamine transporter I [Rhodotorula diobovata]|uniref:Amino acid/polyamine transporter I n=1 Tax=Rhodotorula diobovata TaxID=5288 RepID=A0A5C5FWJ5_9BASI|nr:amino acid/polyamine transporter I [Rhodotorula diobovata]